MNRILLFAVVIFALLFCGCNSAFRPSKTQIRISQDVARYLAKTEMVINNNSTKKQIVRNVRIEYLENDTQRPQLTYKRVKGKIVILQIKDSLGYMRNIAIPQVKLSAYPLLFSTTISPTITYFLLSSPHNQEWNFFIAIIYQAIVINIDAYAGAASMLAKRHARYVVPSSFAINKLSEVVTLDTHNYAILGGEMTAKQLEDIPLPINEHPTPYLSEDFQKKYQFIFTANSVYGLNQALSTKFLNNQESRVTLPNILAHGIWNSFGFHIQPSAKYQWGYTYHSKMDPNLSCNYLLNEIGFLIPYKKGNFEIGGGLGWGMSTRNRDANYVDSFSTFQNKPVGNNRLLEEKYRLIPNVKHHFLPVNGHVQYIYPIKKNIELTASASYSRIPSYSDFFKTETLLTKENITPTITSYKRDELSYQQITIKTVNQIYSLGLSIRVKI